MEKIFGRSLEKVEKIKHGRGISIKKVNDILLQILIWLIIFDSARNYTYLPSAFGYLKDVIVIWFIIWLVVGKKIRFPKMGISFYLLMILVCCYSWIGLVNSEGLSKLTIVIYILKNIGFFISVIVFGNLDKITDCEYEKYIDLYLKLSLVLVAVNIFGYFVPNPIVSRTIDNIGNGYYENRISVGQPAISVFPMIISYFYTLFFIKKRKILKMSIYLIGVIISVSTTGIFTLIFGSIIFILLSSKVPIYVKKKMKQLLLIVILIVGITRICLQNNVIFQQAYNLFYIKVNSIFSNNIQDLSMNARDLKFEKVMNSMASTTNKIFGLGVYGYYSDRIQVGNLENTYRSVYVFYGILGEILFLIFWCSNGIKHLYYCMKNSSSKDLFIVILLIIYVAHAYTLDIFYVSTILLSFGLFYVSKIYIKEN